MKKYILKLGGLILTLTLLVNGCGRTDREEIPQLLEPVAANAAYRPVETGIASETRVLYGTVVPMEYCCFYDVSVSIKEISVQIGDYVNKGDVIANADLDQAQKQLDTLMQQMEFENRQFALSDQIRALQAAQIAAREVPVQDVSGNLLPAGDVSENRVDVEATQALYAKKESELGIADENRLYDEMLHTYRVNKLQEEIDGCQKLIRQGTLRASHSGYVIYVKSLGASTEAAPFENIVLLADPEETCIRLQDKNLDNYTYWDYEEKYLNYAGKKFAVTELSYGADAILLAKAAKQYPAVLLTCPDAPHLTVGETYPIFYQEKREEETLLVGLDSLKGEAGAYYVYVKDSDGGKEKRAVTIGASDGYYAQVLGGLKAGELVYYESETRMPASYDTYRVELSDYRIDNQSRIFEPARDQITWYEAACEGTIVSLPVKGGETVEAGALLCVLQSDSGRAKLAEAQTAITQENDAYAESLKKLEETLAKENDETAKQILSLQKELEALSHTDRLRQLEKAYEELAKNNDGSGKISLYAKEDGIVGITTDGGISLKEGMRVSTGERLFSISRGTEQKLLVQMSDSNNTKSAQEQMAVQNVKSYPNHIAQFGDPVTVTAGGKVYQGVCIGITMHADAKQNPYYFSRTEDGSPAICFCSTDNGLNHPAFYVRMEEESFYESKASGTVTFPYISMKNVIVVPTAAVQEKKNDRNPAKTDYFVWRIVGEDLVKQYVQIDKNYSDVNNTLILSGLKEQDVLAR